VDRGPPAQERERLVETGNESRASRTTSPPVPEIDPEPTDDRPASDQAEMKEALDRLIATDNELAYYQERAAAHVALVCR
jgi:hypothetical protein